MMAMEMQIARGIVLKYTQTSPMSHRALSTTKEQRGLIPVQDVTALAVTGIWRDILSEQSIFAI